MGYSSDVDIGRNTGRRVEVISVDDTVDERGAIQKVTVMALADEIYEFSFRGQPHGLTSVPKKGAVGYMFIANGRPDQAFLMGLEHEDDRKNFAGRKDGESTHYGGNGQEVYHKESGDTEIRTPNGILHLNPV